MILERIVVGVDGSQESMDALRLSARLLAPDGRLLAVTVCDLSHAGRAGFESGRVAEVMEAEAEEAHERARAALEGVPGAEARLSTGRPVPILFEHMAEERARLLALGAHGRSRVAGILFGSVATRMLHDAPCAVLVARPGADVQAFPARVLVGIDGSPESLEAARLAGELEQRFGSTVRLVAATGGKPLDEERLAGLPRVERVEGRPVDALLSASTGADLVLLGARGLHGPRALGSVSERVAHRAETSVLVVRRPEIPVDEPEGVAVAEVMSAPVTTVASSTTLEQVARTMLDRGIGGMPVVGADGEPADTLGDTGSVGKEVHVPSAYPAVRRPRVFERWLDDRLFEDLCAEARRVPVARIMTTPVVAVGEDAPVEEAVRLMLRHDVSRLPVVRDGTPVGIVARYDLLELIASASPRGKGVA
ncbi:MAG TPA: universal stress protein [Gaiellaceae bacterium]|nr:universal stress protein [Gaiellaceae bacterium]